MKKATKLETIERINKIYELLCKNYSNIAIIEYAREHWDIKHARTYQLINKALEKIAKIDNRSFGAKRAEANIRFDELIHKLHDQGDYKDAAWVIAQKNKINGLEEKNINLNGNINHDVTIHDSTEDIIDKIAEIDEILKKGQRK